MESTASLDLTQQGQLWNDNVTISCRLVNSLAHLQEVVADDLALWKDAQDSCSDGACRSEDRDEHSHNHDHCTGIVCSICLHDIGKHIHRVTTLPTIGVSSPNISHYHLALDTTSNLKPPFFRNRGFSCHVQKLSTCIP